jgi:hypothetical protein
MQTIVYEPICGTYMGRDWRWNLYNDFVPRFQCSFNPGHLRAVLTAYCPALPVEVVADSSMKWGWT